MTAEPEPVPALARVLIPASARLGQRRFREALSHRRTSQEGGRVGSGRGRPEPDQPLDPLSEKIRAAGVRPCFEMEQVLPGVEPDDWNTAPIVEAADLHRAGYNREAIRLLEGLQAQVAPGVDAAGVDGQTGSDALACREPVRARTRWTRS